MSWLLARWLTSAACCPYSCPSFWDRCSHLCSLPCVCFWLLLDVSVAIHPTGLSIAVGSKENLVLHNVLIQSLSEQRSLGVKQIRAVCRLVVTGKAGPVLRPRVPWEGKSSNGLHACAVALSWAICCRSCGTPMVAACWQRLLDS